MPAVTMLRGSSGSAEGGAFDGTDMSILRERMKEAKEEGMCLGVYVYVCVVSDIYLYMYVYTCICMYIYTPLDLVMS
jgi:hypothetical protein